MRIIWDTAWNHLAWCLVWWKLVMIILALQVLLIKNLTWTKFSKLKSACNNSSLLPTPFPPLYQVWFWAWQIHFISHVGSNLLIVAAQSTGLKWTVMLSLCSTEEECCDYQCLPWALEAEIVASFADTTNPYLISNILFFFRTARIILT